MLVEDCGYVNSVNDSENDCEERRLCAGLVGEKLAGEGQWTLTPPHYQLPHLEPQRTRHPDYVISVFWPWSYFDSESHLPK